MVLEDMVPAGRQVLENRFVLANLVISENKVGLEDEILLALCMLHKEALGNKLALENETSLMEMD